MKVTSVDGLDATVAAYGNTTLSDDAAAGGWDIIAEVWSDYRDASDPRSLDRIFREVGTQIHAETFEIPKTRKNTKYEIVANEVQHQITALLEKLRRQLAYAVLRSRPYHDGSNFVYGNKTEEPTMCGICTWPIITQARARQPQRVREQERRPAHQGGPGRPDPAPVAGRARGLQSGRLVDRLPSAHAPVHPRFRHLIPADGERRQPAVGFRVDTFDAKIGKSFPILSDRYMRPDTLLLVNFKDMEYGYFANDRLDRKEIPTQGRYQRWLISFQTYGVVARNPRSNIGMIYGLPTG